MVLFEASTLLALLLSQTVLPPATPASPDCARSRAPNGFDCCLHLTLRSSANPFLTQPPSAQPQVDDERTIEDDPKR
jgi:hypothetical protein